MRALVALGSNLGDSEASLDDADRRLKSLAEPGSYSASTRHECQAIGGPSGQRVFLNAAVALETSLSPEGLLSELRSIEERHGRNRSERWEARTIDLDLLLYGDRSVREEGLRVPHPRMTFRPFVLVPAVEVAPEWVHPECGVSLGALWSVLREGPDELVIVGDDRGVVRRWIDEDRDGSVTVRALDWKPDDTASWPAPRLTIDASPAGSAGGTPGPRLVLADCPTEHWQDEVLAAVECVWPRAR